VPPKVEYRLTDFGKSIGKIMQEMYNWGYGYLSKQGVEVDCDMYKKRNE
jgi:DNA-binding HxlR family transcriptional regulator